MLLSAGGTEAPATAAQFAPPQLPLPTLPAELLWLRMSDNNLTGTIPQSLRHLSKRMVQVTVDNNTGVTGEGGGPGWRLSAGSGAASGRRGRRVLAAP